MSGSEHVAANRRSWTRQAPAFAVHAERAWAAPGITWGTLRVPEEEVRALPEDLRGCDVVELGCGTAYFSAWLARRGARPVGVDLTPAQLATARRMQAEHALDFPLIEADAEDVPLPAGCADLVVSEYGASLWCEPRRWIGEAGRLLRPGGRLAFLTNGLVAALAQPTEGDPGERLLRGYDEVRRIHWADDGSIEFHLPHGEWIDLLHEHGFEVLRLVELRSDASDWSRRWPVEEVWSARLGA